MKGVAGMKDIKAARSQIAEVVGRTTVETFNTMFSQKVSHTAAQSSSRLANVVLACIKLSQGETEVDFCFKFDMDLLMLAARSVFSAEQIAGAPVHEDLACEIVNIVCAKVKSHLNEHGYVTEMGFPFIPRPEQAEALLREEMVHMHFFYRDRDDKQGVGVLVNFTVS
jgi:hypothetical protein